MSDYTITYNTKQQTFNKIVSLINDYARENEPKLVHKLYEFGVTQADIARLLGLSRARINQLYPYEEKKV